MYIQNNLLLMLTGLGLGECAAILQEVRELPR